MVIWTVFMPFLIAFFTIYLWDDVEIVNMLFHTFLESISGVFALILAISSLIFHEHDTKYKEYRNLSFPYFIIALYTLIHAIYPPGVVAEWYNTLAYFLGGVLFLPIGFRKESFLQHKNQVRFFIFLGLFFLGGVLSSWFSSLIPDYIELSWGLYAHNSMMFIGALGFLSPFLLNIRRALAGKMSDVDYQITIQGLFLFSTTMLIFLTVAWSPAAWISHLVKAIGLAWLVVEYFKIYLGNYRTIRSRKERLENILISSSNWIWEINEQSQFVYTNKNVLEIIGYTEKEILQLKMSDIMSESGFTQFVADCQWADSFEGKKVITTLSHKDGRALKVDRRIDIMVDINGIASGFRGSDIDKTQKIKQENELMLAENIVRNTWDAIIATDRFDRPIKVNRAFERLTGHKAESIQGLEGSILRSGAESPEFYLELWNHINSHGYWSGEMKILNKFGFEFPVAMNISSALDEDGKILYYLGVFSDISKRKENEKKLKNLAYYDQLTGMPNRVSFQELFQFQIENARRSQKMLSLFYLDLDNFKDINDTMGHDVGDDFLIETARRIEKCIRTSDLACRQGGDEFTILLTNINSESDVVKVAKKLIDSISEAFPSNQGEILSGGSLGIAMYPRDGQDYRTLSKNADIAMFRTKKSGKNNFCFFEENMNTEVKERVYLEREIRNALDNGEFQMFYQPKIDLATGIVLGAEALIRWIHPEKGFIPPDVFIPIAEDTGLIDPLGRWILDEVFKQTKEWLRLDTNIHIGINLSVKQFVGCDIASVIEGVFAKYELDPQNIDFELTESVLALDKEVIKETLDKLKSMGSSISLDDFGTGYSSLSYLKSFPIDIIKIDRSFIQGLTNESDDNGLVDAIILMGRSLGMKVIAEGIEEKAQVDFLVKNGCDQGQGYFFSRALPAIEFENYFKTLKDQREFVLGLS